MAERSPFADELAWAIECLEEAETSVRRCVRRAGDEGRPLPVGKRLKLKGNGIEVQRAGLEEVAEGALG